MLTFQNMPYERPDKDELLAALADLTARLRAAESFDEADAVFRETDSLSGHIETLATLVSIRHSIDTRDEFYTAESDWWDETLPLLAEGENELEQALYASPFRPQLEEKYGSVFFKNIELSLKSFSPEIVPDMQRENALVTEYDKLIASAQIEFEGGIYTVAQLEPMRQDPDDTRRMAAWQATGSWFMGHAEELDRIYDELTHIRDGMGRKLGYDGYTDLGYYRMQRNCYDKTDIEKFRLAVQKYLVPVADKIRRDQAKRLGVSYPMSYADQALMFRSGNPTPVGTADDIVAQGRKFYHELSPQTAEFIDFMLDNGLMDLLAKPGKQSGGYCTELPDYHCPFIFANFNGTQGDVEVISHEAGHAFEAYTARDIVPNSCHFPSMEACEVHSMSMEFFAWPWSEGFFGPDTKKFHYAHLASALTFIPYGTMVDHFQHIVYERPEMSPAERTAVWRELTALYMPWIRLDGEIPFFSDGRYWQRQIHIYQAPFYYIDYCLAQTMALYFWAEMQKDLSAAWERYYRYTKLAGTLTFTELLEQSGLPSPFDEGTLRGVCEEAAQWLDGCDLTGIE
ncbi:MAG: M3 family oligoendopeptidase [Oscillospiraceae bacterium]